MHPLLVELSEIKLGSVSAHSHHPPLAVYSVHMCRHDIKGESSVSPLQPTWLLHILCVMYLQGGEEQMQAARDALLASASDEVRRALPCLAYADMAVLQDAGPCYPLHLHLPTWSTCLSHPCRWKLGSHALTAW